jgi:hypothetical protein
VSLYTVVSRGMAGRLGPRTSQAAATAEGVGSRHMAVRLPGASMRVIEAGLALTAIATAVLIGIGR